MYYVFFSRTLILTGCLLIFFNTDSSEGKILSTVTQAQRKSAGARGGGNYILSQTPFKNSRIQNFPPCGAAYKAPLLLTEVQAKKITSLQFLERQHRFF